jgi:metal-dependent amidase/aminoacylase/carboxypeptidase family protein
MSYGWWKYLPEEVQEGKAPIVEEDFWDAVAEMLGCDPSEISDGDPTEWL